MQGQHNPGCTQTITEGQRTVSWVGDICGDAQYWERKDLKNKKKERESNGKISYICIFIISQLSVSKVLIFQLL